MKKLIISIILLFTSNFTYAQNICDAPCRIFIEFPAGGSITATEGMEILFGLDGVLDPGEAGTLNVAIQPDSLDFSTGGSLSLAPGESITFGNNGNLDLGEGGNISAINYSIVTSGNLAIIAEQSLVTISGMLKAKSLLIASRTLHIDNQNLIVADELFTTGFDISNPLPIKIISNFSELSEGFVWPIDENTNCIVSGNHCVTDSGSTYVINENGDIVEVTDGSGSIDVWSVFFLLTVSLGLRKRL